MNAEDDILLLGAYHDGELSPGEALAMERRLASDPALRALAEQLSALSGSARAALVMPPIPAQLRARIAQLFGEERIAPRHLKWPSWSSWSSWQAIAAMLLIGLVGGGVIGSSVTYLSLSSNSDGTVDAVVSSHLRSLIAPQPFDIASSNRHVVKPWFNGKTTIAPDAPDLSDKGFPLSGGRVDIVEGKPVPTLIYHHDQHVISVTVLKAASAASGVEHRAGSNVEWWTIGDLTYWAVSDMDMAGLRSFVGLFRDQVAHG